MPEMKEPKGAWLIVAMLFLFMFINFADKVVIGLAAVPIMNELQLKPVEFGQVNSAFFFLFSTSAVITGFIVNRIQSRWALLAMALVWAMTQFPMIGGVGIGVLLVCRIILGAGEGPAYPVALHAAYKWFPNERRALPTSVIAQGASIGVMLALPALNWVIINISWHWAFGVLGIVGVIWVLAWWAIGKEGPLTAEVAAAQPDVRLAYVPYARLLTSPTVLGAWAAGFGAYWGLALLVAWLPAYLIKGFGYTQAQVGWIDALPWGASVVLVIGTSWISQRLLANGVPSRISRGLVGGGAVALGGLCLASMPLQEFGVIKLAILVVGMSIPSVIYVMGHAIVSEITPVGQRAALLCISNAVATSAGLLAPWLMGHAIEQGATPGAGYDHGFLLAGLVTLTGGVIGMIFLRPQAELQRFAEDTTAMREPAGA
jgi:MFS transporter, ACS family, D-galactonate transporter